MRFIVFMMILSLGFGGYSAAAHAFADMNAHGGAAAAADAGPDAGDCPDHMQKPGGHTHEKAKCLDCHHCCNPHAMMLPGLTLYFVTAEAGLNPPPVLDPAGDHPSSLLRPPRSLV